MCPHSEEGPETRLKKAPSTQNTMFCLRPGREKEFATCSRGASLKGKKGAYIVSRLALQNPLLSTAYLLLSHRGKDGRFSSCDKHGLNQPELRVAF